MTETASGGESSFPRPSTLSREAEAGAHIGNLEAELSRGYGGMLLTALLSAHTRPPFSCSPHSTAWVWQFTVNWPLPHQLAHEPVGWMCFLY